ncbi:MAG: ferric reductase-like transmembrane domain-containing protein [Slackia sp.]|nr:ferric reductase-like transmembrane domain-containing protein [Slackia sp.]
MIFAWILIATIGVVFVLRTPLKKCPGAFYALAIVTVVLFFAGDALGFPRAVSNAFFILVHKCTLTLALFVVVMFIGVFSKTSRIRRWLQPVRAELSIVACILSVGHMAVYLVAYASRILSGIMGGSVAVALAVAAVLTALLLVLGITSLRAVKRRMTKSGWKHVQMLAYPFFALVYAHLMLMLLPPALAGGQAAQCSVGVYTAVFVSYAVARMVRAVIDRRNALTD